MNSETMSSCVSDCVYKPGAYITHNATLSDITGGDLHHYI